MAVIVFQPLAGFVIGNDYVSTYIKWDEVSKKIEKIEYEGELKGDLFELFKFEESVTDDKGEDKEGR